MSTQTAPARTLRQVGALVSPTWHRLAMNESVVSVPELALGAPATIELPAEFAAQKRDAAEAEAAAAAAFEAALAPHADVFETGLGPAADAFLRETAALRRTLVVGPNQQVKAPVIVRLDGQDGAVRASAVDVLASPGSSVTVVVAADSPQAGSGLVGSAVRVVAQAGARVTLVHTQTLDDGWIFLDDTGLVLEDGAQADVRHLTLGAGESYVGLAGQLEGVGSDVRIASNAFGHGTQTLDFNYLLRHRGPKSTSRLEAQSVLTGACVKTMRDTIDLVHGAKGADGYEAETVLLADERVQNKSIPIILCDEDDVAGNHGATIGHVRPEQLLYLSSRGVDEQAAERLFATALFEEAVLQAYDARIRAGVRRLAASLGISLSSLDGMDEEADAAEPAEPAEADGRGAHDENHGSEEQA